MNRGIKSGAARRSLLWAALLCFVFVAGAAAQRRTSPPPFKISAVKAMLFSEQTGEFSPDVFAQPAASLRNRRTPGGERATATLVVVELTGQPNAYAPQRKLSFTATDSRKTALLRKTSELGIFNDVGKLYLAFWLYDTGCYPVTVSAHLIGQPAAPVFKKTLNFNCGD